MDMAGDIKRIEKFHRKYRKSLKAYLEKVGRGRDESCVSMLWEVHYRARDLFNCLETGCKKPSVDDDELTEWFNFQAESCADLMEVTVPMHFEFVRAELDLLGKKEDPLNLSKSLFSFMQRLVARWSPTRAKAIKKTFDSMGLPTSGFDENLVDYIANATGNTVKILFLAANPLTTNALDIEKELETLRQELSAVKFRDSIKFSSVLALTPDALLRSVSQELPEIVHFSGHGNTSGIALRDDSEEHVFVKPDALEQFFRGRGVKLVVLNSCYSKTQVEAISKVVETVVGTTDSLNDIAARRFSAAFYRTIGNGGTLEQAFKDGQDAVVLHGKTNVFFAKGRLDVQFLPGSKKLASEPVEKPSLLEVELTTTIRVGEDVSEPRWTVTAKNRDSQEYDIVSFRIAFEGTGKAATIGFDSCDTQLPHTLKPRKSATNSVPYRELARSIKKEGISSPVTMRGEFIDGLGDKYTGSPQKWEFTEWLK